MKQSEINKASLIVEGENGYLERKTFHKTNRPRDFACDGSTPRLH